MAPHAKMNLVIDKRCLTVRATAPQRGRCIHRQALRADFYSSGVQVVFAQQHKAKASPAIGNTFLISCWVFRLIGLRTRRSISMIFQYLPARRTSTSSARRKIPPSEQALVSLIQRTAAPQLPYLANNERLQTPCAGTTCTHSCAQISTTSTTNCVILCIHLFHVEAVVVL